MTPILVPPGYKTTEFWLTLAVYVLAAVVSLNKDTPWWTVVATMSLAAIKGFAYVQGRVSLKIAAINATAPVESPHGGE